MKNYYETTKETKANINGQDLTIPKGTELIHIPNCGTASGYAVKDTKFLVSLGVWEHDAKHYYAYVPKDVVFAARYVRKPITAKSDNWQDTANKWEVTISGQNFDYYTGSAHDKVPVYDAVLNCLITDSDALERDFEEWAQEYGYDTDRRKAYAIYEACCTNARKLIKIGIDIESERIRLQDY